MTNRPLNVLVLGATGSIGRYAVDEALRQGHSVRALVRDQPRASRILPAAVELFAGDLTRPGVAYAHSKLRSEPLVRVSGNIYTIVRPGWFDYNQPGQRSIVMLQGDHQQPRTAHEEQSNNEQQPRPMTSAPTLVAGPGAVYWKGR